MIPRSWLFLILAVGALVLVVSCNGATPPSPHTATPRRPTVKSDPVTVPSTETNVSNSIYTEKVDLNVFSPSGAGRDLVIMNCDYCHSWVCAVRGQRTVDHWVLVENVHSGQGWVMLSDKAWRTLFDYLEENFNDRKPEPNLPPAFKLAGCTHSADR